MKKLVTILVITMQLNLIAQNKMGYTWIVGMNGSYGQFDGSSNKPQVGQMFNNTFPNYPYIYIGGHSNICDSVSGKLLFTCNAMLMHDTSGNIMLNGDSLMPSKIYTQDAYPGSNLTQNSLILPKGTTGQYYVFIPTISDSSYTFFVTNVGGGVCAIRLTSL